MWLRTALSVAMGNTLQLALMKLSDGDRLFSSTAANFDVCSPIPNYHYSYTALSGLKMWPGMYRRTLGDGISIVFPIPCFYPASQQYFPVFVNVCR